MQLKRIAFLFAVAAAAMLAGCNSSGFAQYKQKLADQGRLELTKPANGLALSIAMREDKEIFGANDIIGIDVRLTNITRTYDQPADLNIYSEIGKDGLLLGYNLMRLTDEGKRQLVYQTKMAEVSLEDQLEKYPHYVKLQPGFTISRPLQFNANKLQPGIYELSVTYSNDYDFCPITPNITPTQITLVGTDVGTVKLWKGILSSNTVVFEVLEEDE